MWRHWRFARICPFSIPFQCFIIYGTKHVNTHFIAQYRNEILLECVKSTKLVFTVHCYHVIYTVHMPHNTVHLAYTALYLSSYFGHHSCPIGNSSSTLMLLQRVKLTMPLRTVCNWSHSQIFTQPASSLEIYGESGNDIHSRILLLVLAWRSTVEPLQKDTPEIRTPS